LIYKEIYFLEIFKCASFISCLRAYLRSIMMMRHRMTHAI